jgi:hypothetical protein
MVSNKTCLVALVFNLALEYSIRRIQESQGEMELDGPRLWRLLGQNVNTINKEEILSDAIKQVDPGVKL